MSLDWLSELSSRFVADRHAGFLCADVTHSTQDGGCGRIFLAMCHRTTMGRLECPDCGGRDAYAYRVFGPEDESRLLRRIRSEAREFSPFIYRVDGSLEP